jgi:hypothetical protein
MRRLMWGGAVAAVVALPLTLVVASADFPVHTNLIPVNPLTNLYDASLVGTSVQAQQTNDCQAVLAHAPSGPLIKKFFSSQNNGDGTTTYFYTVTTGHPASSSTYTDLEDCGQAVNSSNMYRTDTQMPSFNAGGSTTITLTVATTDEVCDRVELTGSDAQSGGAFDDYSNEVGVANGVEDDAICAPGPRVPETPWNALFVPIGFGALGAAWYTNRRRRATPAA